MHTTRSNHRRTIYGFDVFSLATGLVVLATVATPISVLAQVQSTEQQKCSTGIDKNFAKTVKAVGKEMSTCMKDISKAKAGATCFGKDAKGKIAKSAAKTEAAHATACYGTAPTFGFTGAGIANENALRSSKQLLPVLFGSDLDAALSGGIADATLAKCQQGVAKALLKCRDTRIKSYASCKKKLLKDGATDEQADIAVCLTPDGGGKVVKTCNLAGTKVDKIRGAIAKKCVGVDLAAAFPGCATGDAEVLHACIQDQEACKTCGAIALVGGDPLGTDCDNYDNGADDNSCANIAFENVVLASAAEPAETPGTSGVTVTNPKLIEQFGGTSFSLNNGLYTRWRLSGPFQQPDAIFIVIAGFGGDSNNFQPMFEDLIARMLKDHGLILEMWAYHRREDKLEDTVGIPPARAAGDELAALDFAFGGDMGFAMHPLTTALGRRAVYYNSSSDIPFLAQWTGHVASQDLDAIVDYAHTIVSNGNVFMGGHSAGTDYTARYAATDFDLTGGGPAEPGYGKLRGLVMFEGGAGSTGGDPLTTDSLNRMIAKFDGGLFGAVRDNAPRCVDGTTACTIATEAVDCLGQVPPVCTEPTAAYSAVGGIGPQVGAVAAVQAIQGVTDRNSGLSILQQDFSGPDTSAIDLVPGLVLLDFLDDSTVAGLTGQFLDDDGIAAVFLSPSVATGLGGLNSLTSPLSWYEIDDPLLPPANTPNNGPMPTTLPGGQWGQEVELVKMDRFLTTFLEGDSNASDWYFATSGLSVTSAPGVCTASVCTKGNVGAACTDDGDCAQSISLDSSALSVGMGRRDIVNLTQAGNIDIPVICFGGSNGLFPVGAGYLAFGQSIGTCASPSCDGTPRVVNATVPNEAFPTYGDINGGYEVYIREGLAHNDVTTAEDVPEANILPPLAAFIARNVQ